MTAWSARTHARLVSQAQGDDTIPRGTVSLSVAHQTLRVCLVDMEQYRMLCPGPSSDCKSLVYITRIQDCIWPRLALDRDDFFESAEAESAKGSLFLSRKDSKGLFTEEVMKESPQLSLQRLKMILKGMFTAAASIFLSTVQKSLTLGLWAIGLLLLHGQVSLDSTTISRLQTPADCA